MQHLLYRPVSRYNVPYSCILHPAASNITLDKTQTSCLSVCQSQYHLPYCILALQVASTFVPLSGVQSASMREDLFSSCHTSLSYELSILYHRKLQSKPSCVTY
ncbi:TPA: hypothetical protein ACH3X3_006047 [Trebouxia sp. C0006]